MGVHTGIIVEVLHVRSPTAFMLNPTGTGVDAAVPIVIKNMNFIMDYDTMSDYSLTTIRRLTHNLTSTKPNIIYTSSEYRVEIFEP